eukprot:4439289-Prorocentrum_lima.AAC.1
MASGGAASLGPSSQTAEQAVAPLRPQGSTWMSELGNLPEDFHIPRRYISSLQKAAGDLLEL